MNQKQVAGLLGAALLFAGLFAPVFSSPVRGSINYFHYNRTEAAILLFLGALALTFALVRRYRAMMPVGAGALGMMALALIKFQLFVSGQATRWMGKFADSSFDGINRMVRDAFALEWGWGLLLAGAVLIVSAAGLRGYSNGK